MSMRALTHVCTHAHARTHTCHFDFLRKESRIKMDLIAIYYHVIQKNKLSDKHS